MKKYDLLTILKNILKRLILGKEKNVLYEFNCFKEEKLNISKDIFKDKINNFKSLQESTDPIKDYRNAFFFQFSTTFNNLIEIEARCKGSARAIDIMEIIKPYIQNKGECLSLGYHNGAELFWLYDNTKFNILGLESNSKFFKFSKLLINSYNLGDRINVSDEEIVGFLEGTKNQYDLIILHGLIYMVKDPIHLLKRVYENLKDDGICSIEAHLLKDKEPIMKYRGDGSSGLGATFFYSKSFIINLLEDIGFDIIEILPYYDRKVFLLKKKLKIKTQDMKDEI